MKIKQVCEQTGLTDRTIRYYIEEGLISPYYTENYMGRRAYDFTETDVAMLENIATLRRFGFTVEEIRQVQESPRWSQEIIAQVRERKETAADSEQEALAAHNGLGRLTDYTVSSLVEALGEAAARAELPPEKYRLDAYDVIWTAVRGVVYAAVMFAPVAFLIRWLGWFWKYHRYAVCEAENVLCILLALVPTAVLLIAWLKPEWIRRKWRAWMLCLVYLPVSWSCAGHMLGDSMTTDIRYYRVWDFYVCEIDYRTELLFPRELRSGWHAGTSIDEDTDYFYRARAWKDGVGATRSDVGELVDDDHEIYVAWTLPANMLQAEIERVDALFCEWESSNRARHVLQKGDYTCWVMDFTLLPIGEHDPFGPKWEGGDTYLLFAFDEETGHVRYGAGCDFGDAWTDFPHFREVEW